MKSILTVQHLCIDSTYRDGSKSNCRLCSIRKNEQDKKIETKSQGEHNESEKSN